MVKQAVGLGGRRGKSVDVGWGEVRVWMFGVVFVDVLNDWV